MKIIVFALLFFFTNSKAIDLLVPHCVVDQIVGEWTFSLTADDKSRADAISQCTPESSISVVTTDTFDLQLPNVATNTKTQSKGTWTMIVDVGFEIRIDNQRFLAFFQYKKSFWGKITSYCNKTWVGWFHEEDVIPAVKYGCLTALKNENGTSGVPMTHEYVEKEKKKSKYATGRKTYQFRIDDQKRHMEIMRKYQKPIGDLKDLPKSFDWRKVNGTSYVNYVKDQGQCGSCYIFSAVAAIESNMMIQSEGLAKPRFSEQDMINCGKPYGNGCQGGFPYLVEKFFREYGLVDDKCVPYEAFDAKCKDEKCTRHYMVDFDYIGGYYGASNEENMMKQIYETGPISVSFMVEQSFFDYTSGIITCAKHKPFDADHAVTIVGWGETGRKHIEKFWIVRNSWGSGWGNDGYFEMRKGQNDCNIESDTSFAIVKYP